MAAKSAAERAQENVDLAKNKVDRLQKQWDAIAPKAKAVSEALKAAKVDLEFHQKHPALEGGAAQPPRAEAEVDEQMAEAGVEVGDDPSLPQPAEPEADLPSGVTTVANNTGKDEAVEKAPKAKGDLFDQDDPFAN